METMRRFLRILMLGVLVAARARAEEAAFDLTGPKVDVHVQRDGKTLPIGEVPNLLAGDRLWIHPDLPANQSVHYLLVVAFLRGSTDKPPADWFTRVETWNRDVREEGVFVVVPKEAQQALVFLAPETNGDFSTLRAAVESRPGAFVRATQDLEQASWDRMRLNAYLDGVKALSLGDPKRLHEQTATLARSLGIRIDQQCFDKPSEQQAPCLVQHTNGLVMDDSGAQSMVSQITNGAAPDLMNQLSYSNLGGAGQYSPYVGALVDMARILGSIHTAKYQYIPALALPQKDTLNLRLNVPPSFRDPKSVIVVAMPPVGPSKAPPLQALEPATIFCAQQPQLVLPVDGAPLVFATQLAHDLTLRLTIKGDAKGDAGGIDVPVKTNSAAGGLELESPLPAIAESDVTAVLQGKWGFDNWEGPKFHLRIAHAGGWKLAGADQSALIVGREDTLHLEAESTQCLEDIEALTANASPVKLTWKSLKPGQLEIAVPLKDVAPGPVLLRIRQFGLPKPDELELKAYAEAALLERITLSAGDQHALLKGRRLDEVASAELNGIPFSAAALNRVEDYDQLSMTTTASTAALNVGGRYVAGVTLRDGRQLKVPVTVEPPRPQVELLSKGVQDDAGAAPSPVHMGSANDLALQGRLVFFLRSQRPENFARTEKVEVASADGSFHTLLGFDDGGLVLEDAKTAVAVIDPMAKFGPSAFGPLQLRVLAADGRSGDWVQLGTLVRVPGFQTLRCAHNSAKICTLSGSNLFLLDSVSASADFADPIEVPVDFTGTQLSVPHPVTGTLYVRLRDDPATVQTLTMTVAVPPPPAAPASAGAAPAATPASNSGNPSGAQPPAGSGGGSGTGPNSSTGSSTSPGPTPTPTKSNSPPHPGAAAPQAAAAPSSTARSNPADNNAKPAKSPQMP